MTPKLAAKAIVNKMSESDKRTVCKHDWQDRWMTRIKNECDRLNEGLEPQDVLDEIKYLLCDE